MRTIFLALFLSTAFGMSSAHAQEAALPLQYTADSTLLADAVVPPRAGLAIGTVKVAPLYSFVRHAEAGRPSESGQEFTTDLLGFTVSSPRVTYFSGFQRTRTDARAENGNVSHPGSNIPGKGRKVILFGVKARF